MSRCALVAVGAVIIAATSTISADALFLTEQTSSDQLALSSQQSFFNEPFAVAAEESEAESEEGESSEVTHIVKSGESLTKIAKQHETTWQRLFDKNTELENPDLLEVGYELLIPREDEELEAREVPQPQPRVAPVVAQAVSTRSSQATPSHQISRGSSAGNTYYAGYCTWYAKSRRPDLPNNLGNANTWVARAAAQGIPTGSAPRVGAIGQQGMHVVYVEAVHGNGTVTVSEMNFTGWNQVSRRTVPASTFSYIY